MINGMQDMLTSRGTKEQRIAARILGPQFAKATISQPIDAKSRKGQKQLNPPEMLKQYNAIMRVSFNT